MILTPTEARRDLRRSPALRRALRANRYDPDVVAGLSAERIRETLQCIMVGAGVHAGMSVIAGKGAGLTLPDYGSWQLVLEGDTGVMTRVDGATEYLSAIQDNYTGNGHIYDQATDANQPQHSGVSLNGVQGIGHWLGSHAIVQSAGSNITETTYTLVMVADFQDTTQTQFLLDYENGRLIFELTTGTMGFFDGAHRGSGLVPAAGPAIHVWHLAGSSSFCESDGAASGTFTANGLNVTNSSGIGARYDGVITNPLEDVKIYGLYLAAPGLSSGDLADLKSTYLTPKWGV